MNRCSWWLLHYSSLCVMGGKETAPVTMAEMCLLLFCTTDLQGNLGQAYFTAFLVTQMKPCQFMSSSYFVPCFPQIGLSICNLKKLNSCCRDERALETV